MKTPKPTPKPFLYILHFDQPLHHARHYLGIADDPYQRCAEHQDGNGSKLTRAAVAHGIRFTLYVIGEGDRTDERRLKRQHNGPKHCPKCNPKRQR